MRGIFPRDDGNRTKFARRNSRLWRLVQERRDSQAVKYRACEGDYFSGDLVFQFLVLLPIKSLVRLSCVCKTWFNLIHSSAFAEAHLHLSENTLICLQSKPQYSIPNPFSIDMVVDLPQFSIFPSDSPKKGERFLHFLEVQNYKIKIVELNITCSGNILASCDGLILIELKNDKGIVVMNPMTKKLIRYPVGTICPLSKKHESYGFMYSNREGKYKIVHLFLDKRSCVGCEILSVGSKCWRAVDGPSLDSVRMFHQDSVSAIGALHWITGSNINYIVSMDIESERFFTITLPSTYKIYDRIIEMWGFLGLITHSGSRKMDVWICTGLNGVEDWSKQYTILLDSVKVDLVPVISSRTAREIVFKSKRDSCYYVYDCEHQEIENIEMETEPGLHRGTYLPFVNSLISWEYPRDLQKNECKLSLPICLNIVLLGFIGIFGGILFYSGLEYTSPAFASAISNLNPSMTFVLAILCRMEKLNVTTLSGQAKIGGTIVSFGGATLMTLYKGITLLSLHSHHTPHQNATSKVLLYKNLIKGSILLLVQCLSVSSYFILQTITVRRYPAPLTLTALTSLSGTVTATIIAAILDHKASSWRLSWDITLIAPIYSGIMFFGIASYVQALIVRKRGPVFLTAFRPLSTVIVAIIGLLTLGEALHLGGVMGATMIIFGLYAILWGKEEEKKQRLLGPTICHQEIEIKAEN